MEQGEFKSHAYREAAAIMAGAKVSSAMHLGYGDVIDLLAIAWLQGAEFGYGQTLAKLSGEIVEAHESL